MAQDLYPNEAWHKLKAYPIPCRFPFSLASVAQSIGSNPSSRLYSSQYLLAHLTISLVISQM